LSEEAAELYWDSTYAVAEALQEHHPQRDPENVGLNELALLIEKLPGFADDPAQVTEQLLLDIQSEWYEELNS
jgi:FeS assembly protein IscX